MAGEAGKAGTRQALAAVAREKALLPFRGGEGGNIAPLVAPFPKWSVAEADRLWCAAFVLHCCREAGFDIPYSPAAAAGRSTPWPTPASSTTDRRRISPRRRGISSSMTMSFATGSMTISVLWWRWRRMPLWRRRGMWTTPTVPLWSAAPGTGISGPISDSPTDTTVWGDFMKNVLLSADSEISVFAVPDPVADHLEKYCLEFCRNWLHKSPDAEKYRTKMGGMVVVRFHEKDFIDYLNQYVCDEPSALIATLTDVYDQDNLPQEYIGLPYFNF